MKFAQVLKRLRQENNWSQEQLAEKIGVKRLAVGKYESGQTKPSAETLQRISETFDVSINYLLSDEPDKFAKTEINDKTLLEYMSEIEQMSEEEQRFVKYFLDAVVLRHKTNR